MKSQRGFVILEYCGASLALFIYETDDIIDLITLKYIVYVNILNFSLYILPSLDFSFRDVCKKLLLYNIEVLLYNNSIYIIFNKHSQFT